MQQFIIIVLFLFASASSQDDILKWDYNKKEWSPLMIAIYKWDTEKFSKLIKENKNITFVSKGAINGWKLTALDIAIRVQNKRATEILLKTKKFINLNAYLMTACTFENAEIIQLLFDYGANPEYSLENGHTPLMMVVGLGNADVLTTFLQNDVKTINKQKKSGTTALMLAAKKLDIEKVKILLKYGADRFLKDNKGRTALDYIDNPATIENTKSDEARIQLKELLKT